MWACGFINSHWTLKQRQHTTFFTRPQTQVRNLCDAWNVCLPQPHPRGAWHNWLMQSVYPRAFVCLLCWKPTLGDPRSLHLCAGKVTKSFYVSTRPCEPLSRSSTQYTLWGSKSYQFVVLWTWTVPGRGDVETELWEGVRQGRATGSEAMTRVHKVKWLNTCDFHLQAKWRKLHLGRHTLSIISPVIQTGKQKPNSPRLVLFYRLSPVHSQNRPLLRHHILE